MMDKMVAKEVSSIKDSVILMETPLSEMSKRYVLIRFKDIDGSGQRCAVFIGEQFDSKRKAIDRWMKLTDRGSDNPYLLTVVDRTKCKSNDSLNIGILSDTCINYKFLDELAEGKHPEIMEILKKVKVQSQSLRTDSITLKPVSNRNEVMTMSKLSESKLSKLRAKVQNHYFEHLLSNIDSDPQDFELDYEELGIDEDDLPDDFVSEIAEDLSQVILDLVNENRENIFSKLNSN